MAKQLGGLISLLQGIDLAPMKLAQDRVLGQGQLAIQQQTAKAQADLEKRRLDLAEISARDNSALAREDIGLRRESLLASSKQAEEGRALDRELAAAQQAGRIDIQDLVGAQEMASINLQDSLSKVREQDRVQSEVDKEERLFNLSGRELTRELELRTADEDRQYKLNKSRGIDPGADSQLDRDLKQVQIVMQRKRDLLESKRIDSELGSFEEDTEFKKDMRALQKQEGQLVVKKLLRELEDTDPTNPMVKELKELQLRIGRADADSAEADSVLKAQEVEARDLDLDAAKKKGKAGETPEGGTVTDTDKSIKRISDKVARGSSPVYGISGNQTALKALEHLKEIQDIEGEDYDAMRVKLQRVAELGEKGGKSKVSKIPFMSDARIIGKDLTKDEIAELETLIDELYAEGIYVGYAD